MSGDDRLAVNEHYLDRVVAIAETSGVEATEDIVTGSGIKLVAKGARIDARSKERLLQHKLLKPLESSLRVIDGVATRSIDKVAHALLDRHGLLAGLCGSATAQRVSMALRNLQLSTQVESMLSVYAAQGEHKLEHAVGVSLLSAAMIHDLRDGGGQSLNVLMIAGLMHDVGELYIDPKILNSGRHLPAEQWKHISTHPIVAAHVLRDMPGAGPRVAEAVLYHHERFDGFGYPHHLQGPKLTMESQVLAMAEMLMGVIESGENPAIRAGVAVKLIPGEFQRQLLDRVASVIQSHPTQLSQASEVPSSTLAHRASDLAGTFRQLRKMFLEIEPNVAAGTAALKDLMGRVSERCQRLQFAFSSTGLDTHGADDLRDQLSAMDAAVHLEVSLVLREIEWRLREIKRELRLRAEQLGHLEARWVRQFVESAEDATRRNVAASRAAADAAQAGAAG